MSAETTLRLAAVQAPAEPPPRPDAPPSASSAMLNKQQLAALLCVSVATVERMDSRSRIPAPVKLSRGCVRWRRAEVLAWIEAGCPDRKTWERSRK